MTSRTYEFVWTATPGMLEDGSASRRGLAAFLSAKYDDDEILGYRAKLIRNDGQAGLEGVPEDVVAAAGVYPFVYVHVNFTNGRDRTAIVSALTGMGLRPV